MDDLIIRQNLAAAYRILHNYNMSDLTYTHLSARSSRGDSFYIYKLGLFFSEVTATNLIEVSFDGKILSEVNASYNDTGLITHSIIYKNRADINCIFHLHTTSGVAISSLKHGLLPISQFSLHFFENIAYHDYNSLVLDPNTQGSDLCEDLGDKLVMMMKNHGTITCGTTIHEAMFYSMMLENACKVQVLVGSNEVIIPDAEVCRKARKDMRNFEKDLGLRDWRALVRELEKTNSNYKK
jgi:ribulose-5-phosphate 4-epimerase/fuculose-1-phosphate aldolase